MTLFFKYYLSFSNEGFANNPPYHLFSYRRYLKSGNFRSAIGGNFSNYENPSPYNGDSLTLTLKGQQYNFSLRIGYELYTNINEKWQLFYGVDLNSGYSYYKYDGVNFSQFGYAQGYETNTTSFGLAPVIGLRYRLNKRMSLITESSLLVNYSISSSRNYYTPLLKSTTSMPGSKTLKTKNLGTTFYNPISLVLTIAL
jgi:hypothetical protein